MIQYDHMTLHESTLGCDSPDAPMASQAFRLSWTPLNDLHHKSKKLSFADIALYNMSVLQTYMTPNRRTGELAEACSYCLQL